MELIHVLKCARIALKKRYEEKPDGGIKLTTEDGTVVLKYDKLVKELERLIETTPPHAAIVGTCETCKWIDQHKLDSDYGRAMCYPENPTSWRTKGCHCQFYKPKEV